MSEPKLLSVAQASEAGEVLGRAFFDDPLQRYFLPDDHDRRAKSPPMFQALVTYGCMFGEVLTPAAGGAAAVWMKPGETQMTEDGMTAAGFDALPEAIGEDAFTRFVEFFGYIEPYHHRSVPPEHWYLAVIGVDTAHQRKGIGKSLIRPILSRADAAGIPCYLETAQPNNVPLYTGLGFNVLVEEVEPKSGVRFWTFRRDPPG
jgi:ribosomal protein S18 acetylase RimI-like enzyme